MESCLLYDGLGAVLEVFTHALILDHLVHNSLIVNAVQKSMHDEVCG